MQVSHVNTSALLLLRQANAAATGRPVDPTGVDPRTGYAAQVTNSPDAAAQAQRFALYQKLGDALGVKMQNFASGSDFAAALTKAVSALKLQSGTQWSQVKVGLEQKLGLDKLGVSLDTVIASLTHPDAAKTLDGALTKHASARDDTSADAHSQDAGLYSPASALG